MPATALDSPNPSPQISPCDAREVVRGLSRVWHPRGASVLGPLLGRVLAARGLTDGPAAAAFLDPSLRHLHDPSGIPDLDRAAERLLGALGADEPIVIYGDYDVDGITATAILYHMLRSIRPGARVSSYVPHRLEEGYGLNSAALREIAAAGARVVVSVDCGITAVEPARAAREAGLDLIITDHHTPPASPDGLPGAYAVVHPRRHDSAYPFGDLCGAGVAYKLAWRLATMSCGGSRVSDELRALLLELLAPAALGVIADVVPLVGENRVIARFGLSKVKNSAIPGLRALVEASGLAGEKISAEDVGFKMAPRLNACGRMGHAREAVELLTTAEGARAAEIARELSRLNDRRKATERGIFDTACELAEAGGMTIPDRRAIVLSHPEWHAGVVGIVCSRLVERYHRPVILLCEKEGVCHGSGRSIETFNLHDGLAGCAGLLDSFGGHDMAAGMRLSAANLPAFTEAFTAVCNQRLSEHDLVGRVSYDAEAHPGELTVPAVTRLAQIGPFGRENPAVRLRLRGVRIAGRPTTFGSLNKHLAFFAADGDGRALRIVGWNWAYAAPRIAACGRADLLITPRLSTWGAPRVECELCDIAPA